MKLDVCLETVSDEMLIARVVDLLGRGRRVEAELVAHLAEVDARRLFLGEACPSMHAYATQRLHLSDAEAYLRITVTRLSRRFPVVLDMLADGRLHLSGIARLAPHVREGGGEKLLARAAFLSRRDIEHLIAELAPQADAPAFIRKLPARAAAASDRIGAALVPGGAADGIATGSAPAADRRTRADATLVPGGAAYGVATGPTPAADGVPAGSSIARATRGVVASRAGLTPIAPLRYKVQFTASAELHAKITRAQALLRRQVPDGDLAAVVDRAMTLLVRELERARFAATAAPRKSASEVDPTPRSRHIPDPIRRAVWERDGGQCTFRDRKGRRCTARERLEFHHVTPFAQGGDHSVANVRIACAAHDAFQADLDYGAAFMASRRRTEDHAPAG
jgi:hypothetical protein